MTFHPLAISTPAQAGIVFHPTALSTVVEENTSPIKAISENVNHRCTNGHFNVLNSTTNNLQNLIDIAPDISINVLTAGVTSNDLVSVLETSLKEKSKDKNENKTLQSESSIKPDDDRFNRVHFFLKNIATSRTYHDIYVSIKSMYPEVNMNDNLPKIKYICVAGNVLFNMKHIIRL
jgi:hypothetical protein